jgi:hypothetical protein
MKRLRILLPVALAVGLALGLSGRASAEGGGNGDGGGDWAATSGVLEATGDGIAGAGGKVAVKVCVEEGLLLVKGEATIDEGAYSDSVDGWFGLTVYFDFSGCAQVGGEASSMGGPRGGRLVGALAIGSGIDLRAEGYGIAFLSGSGAWANNSGESGAWSPEGKFLPVIGKKPCEPAAGAQENGGDEEKDNCAIPDDSP